MIKFQEQHQTDLPMSRLITSSNSAKVPGDLDALANAARSSRPTPAFNEATTASNDRDVVRLKRCTSTCSELPLHSFLSRANARSEARPTPGRNRHRQTTRPPSRNSHHQRRETRLLLAISSGSPSLPSGTTFEIIFNRCCPVSEEPSSSLSPGVSVEPGLTAFTRMWRLRKSVAHVRANERTAALVAL